MSDEKGKVYCSECGLKLAACKDKGERRVPATAEVALKEQRRQRLEAENEESRYLALWNDAKKDNEKFRTEIKQLKELGDRNFTLAVEYGKACRDQAAALSVLAKQLRDAENLVGDLVSGAEKVGYRYNPATKQWTSSNFSLAE